MAKLATIEKLRTALAKDSYGDLNMVLNAALEVVTPAIEGVLLTTFTRFQDRIASYSLANADVGPGGMITLHLPQAFLVHGSLQVKVASSFSLMSEAVPVDSSLFLVDGTRGYVTLFPEALTYGPNGGWVKVTGTYGFNVSADALGHAYQSVPSWLEQSALQAAMEVYDVIRQTNDTETPRKDLKLPAISMQSLAMYRRTKQPVVYPV